MSRETDRISTADLIELMGLEEPPGEQVCTHSGYWLKDGLDSYRFVWTVDHDED